MSLKMNEESKESISINEIDNELDTNTAQSDPNGSMVVSKQVLLSNDTLKDGKESNIFDSLGDGEVEVMEFAVREDYSTINGEFNGKKQEEKSGKICLVTHHAVSSKAINKLREKMKVVIIEEKDTQEVKLEKAQDVDAIFLVRHNMKLDHDMLDFIGERLAVVGLMSAGYDNVNVRELTRRNIKISNVRSVQTESVADLAICLALAVAHNFKQAYNSWLNMSAADPDWILGKQLSGSICGIVGYGDIGDQIATRLLPFRVKKILYNAFIRNQNINAKIEYASLDDIVTESDFIFVVCPLTEKTHHLFDYEKFKEMKSTCVFVNVGRGAVIKQNDLVKALRERLIWGAGLDVTYPEPISRDHPLMKLDNCLITPHIGSATLTSRESMASVTADNIIAALEDKPMPSQVCFKPDRTDRLASYMVKRPTRILANHLLKIASDHKYKVVRNI